MAYILEIRALFDQDHARLAIKCYHIELYKMKVQNKNRLVLSLLLQIAISSAYGEFTTFV